MRKLLTLAALALLTLAGCRQAPPPTFHFKCKATLLDTDRYQLLVGGRPFATFVGEQEQEFDLPGRVADDSHDPRAMLPVITAQVPYICGWRAATVRMMAPPPEQIEQARKEKRPVLVYMEVEFLPIDTTNDLFFVDNRGGPAATLSIGALDRPVDAGTAQKINLPFWPGCAQARQVRLNGEPLVTLDQGYGDQPHYFFVDTSGKRCYRLEVRTYGVPANPHIETLKPQRVRPLSGTIEYFLEELPGSVMSELPVDSKTGLLEVPCR